MFLFERIICHRQFLIRFIGEHGSRMETVSNFGSETQRHTQTILHINRFVFDAICWICFLCQRWKGKQLNEYHRPIDRYKLSNFELLMISKCHFRSFNRNIFRFCINLNFISQIPDCYCCPFRLRFWCSLERRQR